MTNPITTLSKKEKLLWFSSLAVVLSANLIARGDVLTLIAACVGVTSLIFAARGHVCSQLLMIVFSLLYGLISFRFRYWGEMLTYLGMTLPMAVWAAVTWAKNPSQEHKGEVAILRLRRAHVAGIAISCTAVTAVFYLLLDHLDTPNLLFSTVSVFTSFLAAALTMLRSSYYAMGYAANDLVLIVLWTLASLEDPTYIPVVVNFVIFFVNDMYGFASWKKREKRQELSASALEGGQAA